MGGVVGLGGGVKGGRVEGGLEALGNCEWVKLKMAGLRSISYKKFKKMKISKKLFE